MKCVLVLVLVFLGHIFLNESLSLMHKKCWIPEKAISAKREMRSGGMKERVLKVQSEASQLHGESKLKIIGGSFRGRKLLSPMTQLRPMMGKVREAVFNSISNSDFFRSGMVRVFDGFSGSGSIGLEAISRGANHSTFIDIAKESIDTCCLNAKMLGVEDKVHGVIGDVLEVLRHPEKFKLTEGYDLLTLTPPYEEIIYKDLLDAVCQSPLLHEDSMVLIEYPVELGCLPFDINNQLYGLRNRKYGRTVIATYINLPRKKYDFRSEEFLSFNRKVQRKSMKISP